MIEERIILQKDWDELVIFFLYEDMPDMDDLAAWWKEAMENSHPRYEAGVKNVLEGWER